MLIIITVIWCRLDVDVMNLADSGIQVFVS